MDTAQLALVLAIIALVIEGVFLLTGRWRP